MQRSWPFISYRRHVDVRKGGGQWTIISLPNSLPLFHMLMSMCPNFGKKMTTYAEVTQKSVEQSYNTRTNVVRFFPKCVHIIMQVCIIYIYIVHIYTHTYIYIYNTYLHDYVYTF